jgi:protein-disulfide isomerase
MTTRTKADQARRRERAAAAREAARRAERRRRLRTVLLVAVLVLVVGAGIAVQAARSTSGAPSGLPAGTVQQFGIPLGSRDAPVTVELYEDFLCPACRQFEEAAGSELRELAAEGTVRVVYRPFAFLDGYSTTRYCTRALNAAACAADQGRFVEMHDQLFRAQPPEGGPGLSDDRLVALGQGAGADSDDFAACVNDLRYERWTQQATDAASKAGVVQTPTVVVNGQRLPEATLDALRAAVAAAAG